METSHRNNECHGHGIDTVVYYFTQKECACVGNSYFTTFRLAVHYTYSRGREGMSKEVIKLISL